MKYDIIKENGQIIILEREYAMFKVDETILYGTDGVCRIADMIQKNIDGKNKDFYVLRPIYDSSATIFVPKDNSELTGRMKRVISAEEAHELIRNMPEEETIWIENESERKEKYKAIITNGDRRKLVQLVKTLYLHQKDQKSKGRKLHMCDERFLKDAERILYDELALVLDIGRSQVLPFITEQLEQCKID